MVVDASYSSTSTLQKRRYSCNELSSATRFVERIFVIVLHAYEYRLVINPPSELALIVAPSSVEKVL